MDYMAYDQQNDMYLVLAGTSWVPSKRRDLVKPSSKEKLERMINQVSKAYDGHFDIVPVSDPAPSALSVFDPALDRANEKNPPKPKVSVVHNMEVDKPIQLLIEAIDVLVTAAEPCIYPRPPHCRRAGRCHQLLQRSIENRFGNQPSLSSY